MSCYGKVEGINRLYIGDWVELIAAMQENGYKFGHTSCRYVRPYFVGEESIKLDPSRIL